MALDRSLGPLVGSSVTMDFFSIFVWYFKPMTSLFLSYNLMVQCQFFKISITSTWSRTIKQFTNKLSSLLKYQKRDLALNSSTVTAVMHGYEDRSTCQWRSLSRINWKGLCIFLAVPLRGGTVTDVCTIYYVGIFPMQSVLFRYVHPARRVNSPLSGHKGHVYVGVFLSNTECINKNGKLSSYYWY